MGRDGLARFWPDLAALGLFAALFVPYPLTSHLAGNCDTYLGMALVDSYGALLREWWTGVPAGRAMWPASPHGLGEATPLVGLGLAGLRAIGLSWPWLVWSLMTALFAANVAALRRAVGALTGDPLAGVVAGFGFGVANTLFAHVDDLILVFWAIPATVTWLWVRAEERERPRWLLGAALLGAAQAYVSLYVYAFQSVWLAAFALGRWRRARPDQRRVRLAALALYVGLALPLIGLYAGGRDRVLPVLSEVPWPVIHAATGLAPGDWLTSLPDNLVHGGEPIRDTADSPYWANVRRRVSFGWLWLATALAAFVLRGPPRVALGLAAGFGLLFAVGFPWPPSTPLVELVPGLRHLRIVSRAHLLVLFCATLAVGYALAALRQRWPRAATAVFPLLLALHALENLPLPLPGFASLPLAAPPALVATLADEPTDAVLLHLPADQGFVMHGGSGPLFPYNRELLYMLWQPQHRRHTVNGMNGYLPPERLRLEAFIRALPAPPALAALSHLGVTHLALHPALVVTPAEERLSALKGDPTLEPLVNSDALRLWRLAPQPSAAER